MSTTLAALQQLREAEDRALRAEATATYLREENTRLRERIEELESQDESNGIDMDILDRAIKERDTTDQLVYELQKQVLELTKRNTTLEVDAHTRHAALRQQYIQQVEALELEVRRAQGASRVRGGVGLALRESPPVQPHSVLPFSTASPSQNDARRQLL